MQIRKETTVAFTGYRTSKMRLKQSDRNQTNVVYTETYFAIKTLCEQGYTIFLSGCCEGFDLIAAKAVLELQSQFPNIRLVAVIPFKGQDDNWDKEDRLAYEHIISVADHRIVLAPKYISNQQYLDRNDYMLANSSHVICYYDGQRGGTMYTFNRAKKAGMPITNICTRLIDYYNNTSKAKRDLQSYSYIEGFKFCKEGIMFEYTSETPIIIPFENIDKTENIAGRLHITLTNGQCFEVSLISDDCAVTLAPQEEPTFKDMVSACINKVKNLIQ